jgi:DNA-directed RNA polymerase specialized sigma24 family protein
MSNLENDLLIKLNEKMDLLIGLMATQKGKLDEHIILLDGLGFQPAMIAKVTGKTSNHIRVRLHELRRNKR